MADEPLAKLPRSQETALEVKHEPVDGVAETNVPVDGTNAVRATLVAPEGPAFLTVAVNVDVAPVALEPDEANVTPRSALTLERSFTALERRL